MAGDDPFGLYDSTQRTAILRPRPGGGHAPPAINSPPAMDRPNVWPKAFGQEISLVKAAEPLLALAPCLQTHQAPEDPDELQAKVRTEIQRFVQTAANAGMPNETIQAGSYALCALIDDVILNTPWGARSRWPAQRLAADLHQDVDAGRGFFRKLDELVLAPDRNQDVIELMYVCLAMGFEGVYRVDPPAGRSLAEIKSEIYRLLVGLGSQVDRSLSPNWQGANVGLGAVQRSVPPWTAGVAALALLAILYAGFSVRLAGYSDDVAGDLPTTDPVSLARIAPPAPPPPPAPVMIQAREEFLGSEQREGLVDVTVRGADLVVSFRGEGLFSSGSSHVQTPLLDRIKRVGQALEARAGAVIVVGHTDSVGSSAVNVALSKKRAAAVARELDLSDPARLTVEGVGDTQPIASNETAEGRRRNRRIEIVVPR